MHALIVTYALDRSSIPAQAELCEQVAPALGAVEGLVSMTWFTNLDTDSFGGFYLFERKRDFDRFVASELFALLGSDDANASDFAVAGQVVSTVRKEASP